MIYTNDCFHRRYNLDNIIIGFSQDRGGNIYHEARV